MLLVGGLISEPGLLPLLTDPATETIRLGAIVQVIGALTAIPTAAMLVTGRRWAAADRLAMGSSTLRPLPRVVAWAGLGWLVLFVLGGILLQGEPPAADQGIEQIREFFAGRGTRYLIGDYLSGVAFVLFLVPFAAGLAITLRRPGDDRSSLACVLVVVGAVLTVAVGDGATAFLDALALGGAARELQATSIQTMLNANEVGIAAIGMPMALFGFAGAYLVYHSSMPRPIPWVAVVSGVLHLVGATFIFAGGLNRTIFLVRFGALIAFGLFILATSIALLRKPSPTAATERGDTK